ncbi:MAG: phosphoribosylglycinamide formyltransferase [Firmicutes bacterium]|jgi:phosphoribosylglycinamide formyltransferase-1|nr:phosphoribosylglycinamide formyltransferase [Bacillota bacterium]
MICLKNIAVLASGEGTNLQAIMDAVDKGEITGKVVLVISDRHEARALVRARKKNIKALFIDPAGYREREDYDSALVSVLQEEDVDLVVLAGFMRLLSATMIDIFRGKIMNIHPSLLPSFPGCDGVKQAIEHGVKITGCTVHFVDEGLDTGPIIIQDSVVVLQDDTLETLQQRIHSVEHRAYIRAIDLYCRDMIEIEGRRCVIHEKQR